VLKSQSFFGSQTKNGAQITGINICLYDVIGTVAFDNEDMIMEK